MRSDFERRKQQVVDLVTNKVKELGLDVDVKIELAKDRPAYKLKVSTSSYLGLLDLESDCLVNEAALDHVDLYKNFKEGK